jgi:hypothetical protein
VRRTQFGIIEDINHEVFSSLLESQKNCALHLQVTLSGYLLYDSRTTCWKEAFLMRRSVVFWNLWISLVATIPGHQRLGFLMAIAFCVAACAAFVAK